MRVVAIAKVKAQCLALVDQPDADGILITKHGWPVARQLPVERASADRVGSLAGRIQVHGDILSTGARWDSIPDS
jgi:hypothetical protein